MTFLVLIADHDQLKLQTTFLLSALVLRPLSSSTKSMRMTRPKQRISSSMGLLRSPQALTTHPCLQMRLATVIFARALKNVLRTGVMLAPGSRPPSMKRQMLLRRLPAMMFQRSSKPPLPLQPQNRRSSATTRSSASQTVPKPERASRLLH